MVERDDLVTIVAATVLHRQHRQRPARILLARETVVETPAETPAKARTSPQQIADQFAIHVAAVTVEIEEFRQQQPIGLALHPLALFVPPAQLIAPRPQVGQQLPTRARQINPEIAERPQPGVERVDRLAQALVSVGRHKRLSSGPQSPSPAPRERVAVGASPRPGEGASRRAMTAVRPLTLPSPPMGESVT